MATYLRYIIKNLEPLRIGDDATSQEGQTSSVRFIPGSAVRGLIVNSLSTEEDFEEVKPLLFSSEVVYLNAYPIKGTRSLMPSPKGFYEDKTDPGEGNAKEIQNVVLKGDFSDGMKRASLGSFCYIDDKEGCIRYYSVKTSSDMKILVNPGKDEKRSVFRLEMLAPDQFFEGYIRLTGNEKVDGRILGLLEEGKTVRIGNARFSGLGKCLVVKAEKTEEPWFLSSAYEAEKECYMMLLSDTAMRDENGEYHGLYLPKLEELFGVKGLTVSVASTSVRMVHGYNRTWGGKRPTIPAYTAGSVFHLTYEGTLTEEKMRSLMEEGIGVQKKEGMGRIYFLKDYDRVHLKLEGKVESFPEKAQEDVKKELSAEEKETLRTAAKVFYRNTLEDAMERYVLNCGLQKSGVKNSQLGQIEARLLAYQYDPEQAHVKLSEYFSHALERQRNLRVQQERAPLDKLAAQVMKILETSIEETLGQEMRKFRESGKVMGIPVKELFFDKDDKDYRIKLLIQMIRFDRKGD